MPTWTSLFPNEALLLGRLWFKTIGLSSLVVPSAFSTYPGIAPKYMRAMLVGSGGQGDQWGGGSAYARSVVPVSPGDALSIQVGNVGTGSSLNDSFVKRGNGQVIAYADRGRGIGVRGVAANSTGDVTRDGQPGGINVGGACASDASDYAPGGFGGVGSDYSHTQAADYGCGGHGLGYVNEYGIDQGHVAWAAGPGLVCLEFFDSPPGY